VNIPFFLQDVSPGNVGFWGMKIFDSETKEIKFMGIYYHSEEWRTDWSLKNLGWLCLRDGIL